MECGLYPGQRMCLSKVGFGCVGSGAQELPFFPPPPVQQIIQVTDFHLLFHWRLRVCAWLPKAVKKTKPAPSLSTVTVEGSAPSVGRIRDIHRSPKRFPGCSAPARCCCGASPALARAVGWCTADEVTIFKLPALAAVFWNSKTDFEFGASDNMKRQASGVILS